MNFRKRLALFLVVTLVVVQGLAALCAYLYLRQDLLSRTRQELADSTGALSRQLEFLSERVADSVQVLSLDYALRTAIARRDGETQISALRNHGHRIGAARMVIVGLDGKITADTKGTGDARFPYPGLLREADAHDKGTGLISAEGGIFWVVVVPVRAPVPVSYIAAFVPLDDALLDKVRSISSSREAIALTTAGPGGRMMIAAESASGRRNIELPSNVGLSAASGEITDHGKEYLAFSAPLAVTAGSAPVFVLFEYPLDDALASYRGIIAPMIGVLLLGLLAMLAGAAFIVRGVSRPLETLAAAARRIAVGDYTAPPHQGRRDEIGALSDALSAMTASVAEREQGLKNAAAAAERARRDAESANRAKSQFLSNMSHELRTPLNAIIGFSEMIEGQVLGPVGVPKYAGYAGDIHGAGQHLLGLVERMLNLAEADANRLVLKREPFSPGDNLESALAALEPFAVQSGVSLIRCLPPSWPQLKGEAEKLQQALTNVLHNAIRFTPKGGSVTISAECSDRLTLTISDTGPGMDAEMLEAVTKPFHRLRNAFDGTHQGAGLGLPYAKVIVELHGGTLVLASEPGKGTAVTITLPVADSAREAA